MLDARNPRDVATVVRVLAAGGFVAHPFANLYAISSRPDAATVRRLNLAKGRLAGQVGSVTTTPERVASLFDWSGLPDGLCRQEALDVVETLFALGPFGFRGPAAPHVPDHLVSCQPLDPGGASESVASARSVRTVQVIAPGTACPANDLLRRLLAATGDPFLHVTSANRSHRVTGAVEEPAHFRAAPLAADLAGTGVVVLRGDEAAARAAYPRHAPMSTTVLGLHRLGVSPSGARSLLVERHGSLPVEVVREVLRPLGWAVALSPSAATRLPQRDDDGPLFRSRPLGGDAA